MRQFAQVISIVKDENIANVLIRKHSACGKCGNCNEGNDMELKVKNNCGAKPGDMVILEMKESRLLNAAMLIYLLPLVGLIIGYLGAIPLGIASEAGRIGLGFLLFAISFMIARLFGKKEEDNYDLEITGILK